MPLFLWHIQQTSDLDLQQGTKIKDLSVGNPELTNVLPLKPGVGQSTMHASPTARNFFLVLILTFLVHSPSFIPNPLPCL